MVSKVDVANQALAHIRAQSINSFTEGSLNSQYVKLFYPQVLEMMIADHNWNFFRSERALAVLTDELFDYAYTYQYPTDCVRVNYLKSPVNQVNRSEEGFAIRPGYYDDEPFFDEASRRLRIPYTVRNIDGNQVIGANEPDLWIDYRALIDDPNKYNPQFIDAFSWLLGAELAIPIIGGDTGRAERQNCTNIGAEKYKMAIAADMNERDTGMKGGQNESEFILIRS